jgi:ATP-binding cassette subfamily F protein uup
LQDQISQPEFYQQAPDKVASVMKQLHDAQQELESSFERWAELDERQK